MLENRPIQRASWHLIYLYNYIERRKKWKKLKNVQNVEGAWKKGILLVMAIDGL